MSTWKLPAPADEMPVLHHGHSDPIDWRPSDVRITVPLFNTIFTEDDTPIDGRIEVARDIIIGRLTDQEAERVKATLLEDWDPHYRLEVHHHTIGIHDANDYRKETEETVRRVLALLCCAIRATPRWPSIVLDHYEEGVWNRFDWIPASGGGFPFDRHGVWTIKDERVRTWGELLTHFPEAGRFPSLDLALEFFYDSVIDRKAHPHKALITASTADEILLASDTRRMVRRTLSDRGAALAAPRHQRDYLRAAIKLWYQQRSELVHEGRRPHEDDVIRLQQYLMRAIPSMAALALHLGDYSAALDALDEAAAGDMEALPAGFHERRWWSKVDVLAAFKRPAL